MSCAALCSVSDWARPTPHTKNAPRKRAMTPAVIRSEADLEPATVTVTERAAMTTSVLGRGETSPRNAGAIALDAWQVSWLAGPRFCPPSQKTRRLPSGILDNPSPLYSRGVGCDRSALMGTPATFPLNSSSSHFRKPIVYGCDTRTVHLMSIEGAT